MQGQKGKCKDDIKSCSLDRFEQVERSKKRANLRAHRKSNHEKSNCCVLTKKIERFCARTGSGSLDVGGFTVVLDKVITFGSA